jgi:hypothetical protein
VAGTGAALTGLGGAVVIIPLLSNLTKLSAQQVTGITVLSTMASCACGMYTFTREGVTNLPVAFMVGSASIPSTVIGVWLSSRVSSQQARRVVGVTLLLLAPTIMLRQSKPEAEKILAPALEPEAQRARASFMDCVQRQHDEFMMKLDKAPIPSWVPGAFQDDTFAGRVCLAACKLWGSYWDLALLGLGIGGEFHCLPPCSSLIAFDCVRICCFWSNSRSFVHHVML